MERKKLELELNKPTHLEMLYDQPKIGESQYGEYFLYAVRNGDGNEYSFFAPDEVHSELKNLKKGNEVVIIKKAEQKNKKVVTSYQVDIVETKIEERKPKNSSNGYYDAMVGSFEDAIRIQEKFNGMANVNQVAITLFIQKSKQLGG